MRRAANDAHEWLSAVLERPVRLAWLDDREARVSEAHGGLDGDALSHADAGPLLLGCTASLSQLKDWMVTDALARGGEVPARMDMARFRPNIEIDGVPEAFERDRWRNVRIGAVLFRFSEHCNRCVSTTLDPKTLSGGKSHCERSHGTDSGTTSHGSEFA